MHQEAEVYVDDMVAKSRKAEDHLVNLRKGGGATDIGQVGGELRNGEIGATSILGFIGCSDPTQAKAIIDMPPPQTEKEVRGLLGRLQDISRLITQLTKRCEPSNGMSRGLYSKSKAELMNPPILVPPTPGRPLLLYISTRKSA